MITDWHVCAEQHLVFVIPPRQFRHSSLAADKLKHGVDLSHVWFGRVLLLFKAGIKFDEDLEEEEVSEHDLAFLEVFSRARVPAHVNPHRRIMIYAPKPKMRVYVIPMTNILGKLPVVPAGDTGTLSREYPPAWFEDDGMRDPKGHPGGGSEVWYVNEWAMRWATDDVRKGWGRTERDSGSDSESDAEGRAEGSSADGGSEDGGEGSDCQ